MEYSMMAGDRARCSTLLSLAFLIQWGMMTEAVSQDLTLYGSARADAIALTEAAATRTLGRAEWEESLAVRRELWLDMLGLNPLPQRSELDATITGTLERDDYVVEKIHFQSLPGAYVIGNLYRPAKIDGPLPAVLYLCGHTKGKVNEPYQANPRWFAQHGYVALVLDPIQLGESQGLHHGTFRENRWDWHSRGYTPAGTEVWNAMRALDYLETRQDVDSARMGVTGLSGGGVISWCLGAADTRVKVVVPVCQTGSIRQVVEDRSTDGHCDCAFWVNYYRWDWPDLASLIAPRPFLIASGSKDVLWRPSGYRVTAREVRKQYYQLGANEKFELVEDATPHGYTPKLRKAIFEWFNKHLKGDNEPVLDDVTDYIEPEKNLLVFGGRLPDHDTMRTVDRALVHKPDDADILSMTPRQWAKYQAAAKARLLATTFRNTLSANAEVIDQRDDGRNFRGQFHTVDIRTEDSIRISTRVTTHGTEEQQLSSGPLPTLALSMSEALESGFMGGGRGRPRLSHGLRSASVEVRNTGASSVGPGYLWTLRRTYPLLGYTLEERQLSDLLAAVSVLKNTETASSCAVLGHSAQAPLAVYAGVLSDDVDEIVLQGCPSTHEDATTAAMLGVLRVGDLPHNLALAFPKPITFIGKPLPAFDLVVDMYQRMGQADKIRIIESVHEWSPR
ncbi:MAG: acetylxylan esterase [Aureliella sp.]